MKKRTILLLSLCLLFAFPAVPLLPAGAAAARKVDIDLTKFSATMVYAEVFNMLISPETYEGKTIRVRGDFYVFERENGTSFACIIQDATACCAQGLSFSLRGNPTYPQDYPSEYSTITLVGTYHQYEADGLNYIELIDCVLE